MYKILLCCVSGVTTNKLVKAVKESAKQKDIKVNPCLCSPGPAQYLYE